MLLNLIGKEMKEQLRNITFYLFVFIIIMFYASQFIGEIDISSDLKPISPEEYSKTNIRIKPYYGSKQIDNPQKEIQIMYSRLLGDANMGELLKYGFPLNKYVNLSSEQKEFMRDAATKISSHGYVDNKLKIDVTYEHYLEIINEVDKKLGENTYFGDKYRDTKLRAKMSYEEALEDFNEVLDKDKLTNAYGRIFADYMGITAGLFPIFLGAFLLTRDKRSRMQELIYSRRISSYKYVIAKYIALNIMIMFVYLIMASHATYIFARIASANDYNIAYFAFYKYTILWIMPTVMFTTAIGFVLSILFGNGIVAIPIQFGLWMISLMPLKGDYRLFKSVIRFNSVGNYELYMAWKSSILTNRIFFIAISIILVLMASWIFSYKRGNLDGLFKKKRRTSSLQS